MIETLHAKNFRCLRDVKIDFAPLTVLIGPNDGGKSTILDALTVMSRFYFGDAATVSSGLPTRTLFAGSWTPPNVAFRRDPAVQVKLELMTKSSHCVASLQPDLVFQMTVGGGERLQFDQTGWYVSKVKLRGPQDPPPGSGGDVQALHAFNGAARAFRSSGRYQLIPRDLRNDGLPTPHAVLSPTGDNLVTILDALLTGPDRDAVRGLEDALRDAVKSLRGVSTPAAAGAAGAKTIELVLAGNGGKPVTIPCAHVSDGAMLLLAFLALAYSDTPDVLLIEEPENGLHPERLRDIVSLLRRITTGEVGNRPRQVILTTHSPILLNFVEPEEVRIVRRGADGSTEVTPMMAVPDLRDLLKEFAVGELWYLLGEKALIEGKTA